MEPIYIDVHIHTSDNPDSLNTAYDLDTLLSKVDAYAKGAHYLLSFTDHNTINKDVYLKALAQKENNPKLHLILGVELHINNYDSTPAYHCHIFFKSPMAEEVIDDINQKLDDLYPKKHVEKMDNSIPHLEKIIRTFDDYDFILLPHGGQSHATFDTSIPKGVTFDTTMERNIYYNQFDGFTARSNKGLEQTIAYFKRLGIAEFVNLVTCTDNYEPARYPEAKAKDASPFIPTWMFAEPDFDGFRLSLSENTRLIYSIEKPEFSSEYIRSAYLNNEKIDINVKFSQGLNVVIGGSSSGKTLLVDSLDKKLSGIGFSNSVYNKFGVENIDVSNPSGCHPHYLGQNYIMKVVDEETTDKIEDIDIIKKVFPSTNELKADVEKQLATLKADVTALMSYVENIEALGNDINKIPQVGSLILMGKIKKNVFLPLLPKDNERSKVKYSSNTFRGHKQVLSEIKSFMANNPFSTFDTNVIDQIQEELDKLYHVSLIENNVNEKILLAKQNLDAELKQQNGKEQTKNQEFQKLLSYIKDYIKLQVLFKKKIKEIASYTFNVKTREIESMGHKLFIENNFELTKAKVLEVFNTYLKSDGQISNWNGVMPEMLFVDKFKKKNPKITTYEDFINKVYRKFEDLNVTKYKIVTSEGKAFEALSAGWKTSVILDLVLGYDNDIAPIVIDQPEDNLATNYINKGLVKAIKKMKSEKQIILVSHNATIPMMADAQNIVYCRNDNNKIIIRSAPLEGHFDDKSTLDVIAEITDGGKPSIKKRVKKYNLKKYRS